MKRVFEFTQKLKQSQVYGIIIQKTIRKEDI